MEPRNFIYIIDTEEDIVIDQYPSVEEAEVALEAIEQRYQATGLHRFLLYDTRSGVRWHLN